MFSRAHLLLQRDYDQLIKDQPWGIEAHPLKEDSMFEWTAKILGLKDSVWQGGIFRLYLKFDEHYNARPPEVCFHTIPFHPNVDMITGRPCVDYLDDWSQWQEAYSLTTVLLTVQAMLSNPVLSNAVNTEAVQLLMNSPHSYKQMVLDCVVASQRVEAGFSPHLDHPSSTSAVLMSPRSPPIQTIPPRPDPPRKTTLKLSFDDYHSTWNNIATSKFKQDNRNTLLDVLEDPSVAQSSQYGALPPEDIQLQLERQLEEHNQLMYGNFKTKPKKTENDIKQAKIDQVNKMRKIYLHPRNSRKNTPWPVHYSQEDLDVAVNELVNKNVPEEPWEQEVDDLVAWTNKLDEDML